MQLRRRGGIVVIGHSLGGLVAFHALSDNPMSQVTDVVTIDSPLGGAPASEVNTWPWMLVLWTARERRACRAVRRVESDGER